LILILKGPIEVTISSGNEENRFDIKANDTSVYNAVDNTIPSNPDEYTIEIDGETVTLCKNSKFKKIFFTIL